MILVDIDLCYSFVCVCVCVSESAVALEMGCQDLSQRSLLLQEAISLVDFMDRPQICRYRLWDKVYVGKILNQVYNHFRTRK